MPSLVQISEEEERLVIPLDESVFTIGRNESSDLCLPEQGVSFEHASILMHDAEVNLVDHGSRNGTYVNGVKINRRVLKHRDLIRMGSYVFIFENDLAPEIPYTLPAPVVQSSSHPGPALPAAHPATPVAVARPMAGPVAVGTPRPAMAAMTPRATGARTAHHHYRAQKPLLPEVDPKPDEQLADWSLICGVTGLFLAIPAIPAIILANMAKDTSSKATTHRLGGMALGYVTVMIWVLAGSYYLLRPMIFKKDLPPPPAVATAKPPPVKSTPKPSAPPANPLPPIHPPQTPADTEPPARPAGPQTPNAAPLAPGHY